MLERRSAEALTDAPPTGRRILFFTLVGLSMAGLIWLLALRACRRAASAPATCCW